jgi:hypothetical protein
MREFLILLWYDIKGYFIVRSILRSQKNTVDFNKYDLRIDWVNRVYTVINPSEEDKGDSDEVLKIKAQDKMLPIHRYMDKIGLSEFVSVSAEQVPGTNAYLVVYYPIFRVLTTWKLILMIGSIIGITWACIHFI